ncbi:6-bladed beta-propeller [Algoriphagus kandeliae]|uniref:6-bladed beta-propeller n=1 Tax=Algoriphagus kandeliae TaxID=2562278 RepID=A0A4Y9QRQ5_9BACT|nr:6-bladed beta-propeller [Algoriphagus kandeliae]TFV93595.1 6-bladed beta-propeller [Algoriphagus kandeliae]
MKINPIFYFLIFFFGFACNPPFPDDYPQISLNDVSLIGKENLTIKKIIPLETTSENLMGIDIRVRFNEKTFYLMDEGNKDGIHQFNRNGDYLGIIAPVGDGPDHLPKMDDFFINSDGDVEVLSGIGDQASIYRISQSGEITTVFKTSYLASSFTKLPSGEYLLYGSYNLPFTKFRLVKTDPSGTIISSYLENTHQNKLLPMTERNFFQNQNNLHLIESFQPYVYRFENDSIKRIAQMDFGSYAIPDFFWEEDIMESFGKMSETGFANLHGVFVDEQLMLLSVHVQKPEGIFKELVFIDKSTDKTQKLSTNLNDDMLYHYPIGIENGEVLFLTYRSVILDALPKSSLDKIQKDLPEREFDYPVILKTKIQFDE